MTLKSKFKPNCEEDSHSASELDVSQQYDGYEEILSYVRPEPLPKVASKISYTHTKGVGREPHN